MIVNAAVRAGGTASAYLPDIFPAVASLDVVNAMQQAARELGIKSHIGMSLSRDAFYRQNQALNDTLRDVKAVAVSEMECDTVFVVGNALNVRTGAVVGTDSNIYLAKQPTQEEKEALYMLSEKSTHFHCAESLCAAGACAGVNVYAQDTPALFPPAKGRNSAGVLFLHGPLLPLSPRLFGVYTIYISHAI